MDGISAQLSAALKENPRFAEEFSRADSLEAAIAIAGRYGIALDAGQLPQSLAGELSDAELEGVSGGYTFPQTDWIYCDNPWTNYWCTLRC